MIISEEMKAVYFLYILKTRCHVEMKQVFLQIFLCMKHLLVRHDIFAACNPREVSILLLCPQYYKFKLEILNPGQTIF